MNFEPKHFDKCRFNPLVEKDMDALYSEMSMLVPEAIYNSSAALKYVVLMYDDNTPLSQYETNMLRRKQLAATMAGFDTEKDESLLETIYDLSVPGMVELVGQYMFKYCKQRLWIKIVVNEQLFEEYSKRLMQPVSSSGQSQSTDVGALVAKGGEKDELQAYQIKAKLREELDSIGDSLDKYYREMYQVDEVLAKKQRKKFTPEGVNDSDFG